MGACVLFAIAASGCSTITNGRKIDYRNTTTLPPLEVPPDLTNVPDAQTTASAAPGSTTYSGYAGERRTAAPGASPVLPQNPDVKLVREGQTRYIVVHAEPTVVWDQVKEFLSRAGLSIAHEDAKAGLIDTDWAENRASVGAREGGFFARWILSTQSTAMRDKYRIRLERGVAPGTTEVYLTHRGMEEVAPDTSGAARVGWQPRPSDPELEAEMLHRLVAQLDDMRPVKTAPVQTAGSGTPQETPVSTPSARLTRSNNGVPLLTLEDRLDRAWRRVGLSLDRIGFTVEDRDRSKGIYYVRYIDPDTVGDKPGFFTRMFRSEAAPHNQFQVQVKPVESGSSVEVLDKNGAAEGSKTSERILSLLYEQLK
ncbi:MAG: outer membrane protein assembly factor BamC [Sulfurifustis sp.]